jgi:hypothetical protein
VLAVECENPEGAIARATSANFGIAVLVVMNFMMELQV